MGYSESAVRIRIRFRLGLGLGLDSVRGSTISHKMKYLQYPKLLYNLSCNIANVNVVLYISNYQGLSQIMTQAYSAFSWPWVWECSTELYMSMPLIERLDTTFSNLVLNILAKSVICFLSKCQIYNVSPYCTCTPV